MFLSRGRLMASAKKHGSAPLRGPVLCDAIVKAELKEEDVKRERIMEPNDCIADAKPGASFESLLSSFKYTKVGCHQSTMFCIFAYFHRIFQGLGFRVFHFGALGEERVGMILGYRWKKF
jgi:hypothetical protein